MLLFSAILDIKTSFTKEKFIELAIEWNQNSPHPSNIIPNIQWDGSRNARFGNESCWMEIIEYRNENIIAIRYERTDDEGAIWNTDFIMNYNEMRMAVNLDRSYKEEAIIIDADFSTPHFIRLLIEGDYLENDLELPILGKPIYINKDNISIVSKVINCEAKYKLPVVYVSKTFNDEDPVDVRKLAGRLKGIAHVLVQSSRDHNKELRALCYDKNEYYGAIGVYYPNSSMPHKKYFYHKNVNGYDEFLYGKVLRDVIRYSIIQQIDSLYTWQGVNVALLRDRYKSQKVERIAAENATIKAQTEVNDIYETFGNELDELQQQVEKLNRANEALRYENQGLRAKLTEIDSEPLIFMGEESDLYPGEIKEIVYSAIEFAVKSGFKANTRRYDVLSDIVRNNQSAKPVTEKRNRIKVLLKSYDGLNKSKRQELVDFGFSITEDGKHYKLVFCGDNRYTTCLSKTPSDFREGRNAAAEITTNML